MIRLPFVLLALLCLNLKAQYVYSPISGYVGTFAMPVNCTTTFYDPGGPGGDECANQVGGGNYPSSDLTTSIGICGTHGQFVTIDFLEFAIDNTNGSDYMVIYDGVNAAGPILFDNRITGPDYPFGGCGLAADNLIFCSTAQCLTIEFYASSSENRAGYNCLATFIDNPCVVLPVELLSFEVDRNEISWSTTSEINNDYFTIYHSENAFDWKEYAVVNGNGNSNSTNKYKIIDSELDGYYQLTQTDYDGNTEDLGIKYMECDNNSDTEVQAIYSIDGKFLGKKLPATPGMYIIRYEDGSVDKK